MVCAPEPFSTRVEPVVLPLKVPVLVKAAPVPWMVTDLLFGEKVQAELMVINPARVTSAPVCKDTPGVAEVLDCVRLLNFSIIGVPDEAPNMQPVAAPEMVVLIAEVKPLAVIFK